MNDELARMLGMRRRRPFPGQNPQTIRCPTCGAPATTTPDGIAFVCENRHTGYYDTGDQVIPDVEWRLG